MHLNVFLKLEKPLKIPLQGKYIKKTKKTGKPKKPKKTPGLVFFLKPGFFPTLPHTPPLLSVSPPLPDTAETATAG
jgi:hypothetical protein